MGRHDGGQLLAGGMTMLPVLKQRLASPSHLIDIGHLRETRGVTRDGSELLVKAGTRHAAVAADATVLAAIPTLAALAESIGDPMVRNLGTIGGSVANNDPAADYPAALLALDGRVETLSRNGIRSISAANFALGFFATALEVGEIVTAVRLRIPDAAHYAKFRHPASGYAVAGVFMARFGPAVHVAVTGAGPVVFRWSAAETALSRHFDLRVLDSVELDPASLMGGSSADAAYQAHLVRTMTRRAGQAISGQQKIDNDDDSEY